MHDGNIRMRVGQARRVYVTIAPASGTLTLQATPKATLYDENEAAVAGCNAVNVTGYDQTASAAPRAWHLVDTVALALSAGMYRLLITASDSTGETLSGSVRILLLA